jgi:acetyl esterase
MRESALMVTGRRLLRGALAATALGWAAVGLLLGLGIVLPTPNLGLLWPNLVLDQLAALVEGLSLWLAVFAVLGLALAALARRAGFRRSSLVAAVLGVVTVALSLVPVVQGWRTASQEGVALSLSDYFSFPSIRSPETVTYARPEGEELKLDVRRPPGLRRWPPSTRSPTRCASTRWRCSRRGGGRTS